MDTPSEFATVKKLDTTSNMYFIYGFSFEKRKTPWMGLYNNVNLSTESNTLCVHAILQWDDGKFTGKH